MITRIAFDQDFGHAIRVRGLTLTELAKRAGVTIATASAAVRGRPLNVTTATRLARALAGAPVIPELEAWAHAPGKPMTAEATASSAAVDPVAATVSCRRRSQRFKRSARREGQLRMDIE